MTPSSASDDQSATSLRRRPDSLDWTDDIPSSCLTSAGRLNLAVRSLDIAVLNVMR